MVTLCLVRRYLRGGYDTELLLNILLCPLDQTHTGLCVLQEVLVEIRVNVFGIKVDCEKH